MSKGYAYQEIGRRIRELRGKERQKDWASRIGCDQGYISQVENGVTKPSLSFLKTVSSMTGASIDWILTGARPVRMTADAAKGCRETGPSAGYHGDEVLDELANAPKLLAGIGKLLRMKENGRAVIETLAEMDEERLASLAAFIAADRK